MNPSVKAYNSNLTPVIANANIFLYKDPENPDAIPIPVFPEGGLYIKNDNNLTSFYVRNSLKYEDTYSDKHNLDVLLGQEVRYVDRENVEFTGYGLQYENGYVPFTDPRLLEKIITEGDDYFTVGRNRERTVAFFGKATYGFDDKYIFSLTGRYDGSNRQGRSLSSRWLPTATVSAKWNAINEDFLANSNTISNLQFRTSYGLVATSGSATNALAIFKSQVTDRLTPKERETFLNIADLENSELTWEKQYELNLGFDLALFDNRVQLTADFWKRDIFDNIDLVRTSCIGGQLLKRGNNADVDTKGFEFGLTTKNISTDNFSWSTSLSFSYYDQKITKLQNRPRVLDVISIQGGNIVGYPINSLFSFKFTGLNDEGIPTFALPSAKDPVKGVDFQDSDNIEDYLVFHGSVIPNISGGISNTFKYKNWDLSALITGSGGNSIRLNASQNNSYTGTNVFTKSSINRWILPGDELITDLPKLIDIRNNNDFGNRDLSRNFNAYNNSNVRVADGDFLRMKSISIGYSLNDELINKLGLSRFRIQLQATNLFLLYSDSKLNGQDPEFMELEE